MSQFKYINSLLFKLKIESYNLIIVPMEFGIKLTKVDSPTSRKNK